MELKKYQKNVLRDLDSFADNYSIFSNPSEAYNLHWENKNVRVGSGNGAMRPYNPVLGNVPHVCFKVPTGGGKTFLACCSIKHIFDRLPHRKSKVVVWLVPSDSILEQTLRNLKDVSHPYRQKIDMNWNGRVEVYSKKDLLDGRSFNPTTVYGQLSIMVLSYDTFRITDKEGRKVYQANGNLLPFVELMDRNNLLDNCDESSLMQVIHFLNPVVIVDESHNATSDLSVEMLKNLNPSFVLDLTATPRVNSNIISFVSAKDLKRENMIKLPVVVYNRPNQQEVITDAIDLRNKLERDASSEERYIRPIVLFQAQPRNTEDSTTFTSLKEKLLRAGINEEEIAIKTSTINEIRDVDLLSPDCKIRYIITVNALKEGWDCPFAYILASLANRSSSVDVEQILGRILRLPNTSRSNSNFLNMSYVLTSSSDFRETLDNIVEGLNAAGFTKRDCVAPNASETFTPPAGTTEQGNLFESNNDEDEIVFNPEEVRSDVEQRNEEAQDSSASGTTPSTNEGLNNVLDTARNAEEAYEEASKSEDESGAIFNPEEYEHMDIFNIRDEYAEEARNIKLPQLFIEIEGNIFFGESQTLLTKEKCTEGFTLVGKPLPVGLSSVSDDVYKVDVVTADNGSMHSAYERLNRESSETFKSYLETIKPEYRIKECTESIYQRLDRRFDYITGSDLHAYVQAIVDNMTNDELITLPDNITSITERIYRHIDNLIKEYRYENFLRMVELNKIKARETYSFPTQINPLQHTNRLTKSLYKEERDDLNDYEFQVINRLISCDIKWWHRIIARKENEFNINAFTNHYPDFVVCTKNGTIVLVEVKGEDRDGTDSQQKVKLGRVWQSLSGNEKFKYFMVFVNQAMREEGSISLDELAEIIRRL